MNIIIGWTQSYGKFRDDRLIKIPVNRALQMAKDAEDKVKKAKKEKKRLEASGAVAVTEGVATLTVSSDLIAHDVEMLDGGATVEKGLSKNKGIAMISPADLSPIAKPLADRKLGKKVTKLIKRATKLRRTRRGVKETVKAIRKGEKGILVLAADITPIDIISHLPIAAEDASIPYVFIASKEELGRHCSSRRPTSCVLVSLNPLQRKKEGGGDSKEEDEEDLKEIYGECFGEIGELVY